MQNARRPGGGGGHSTFWPFLCLVSLCINLMLVVNMLWVPKPLESTSPHSSGGSTRDCPRQHQVQPAEKEKLVCPHCAPCTKALCPASPRSSTGRSSIDRVASAGAAGGGGQCEDWLGAKQFLKAAISKGAWSDKASNTFNLHSYETLYEKYFSLFNHCTLRSEKPRNPKMFEIGIGPDGSMRSWGTYKNFFGKGNLDYYCLEYINETKFILEQHSLEDIDTILGPLNTNINGTGGGGGGSTQWMPPKNRPSPHRSGGRMVIGDQANAADLKTALKLWAPFDMIVDDGSHNNEHQIFTFKTTFLEGLAPGGVYFIEDLQTSFHHRWHGEMSYQRKGQTAVQMINDMIKMLSFHWWMHPDFANRTSSSNFRTTSKKNKGRHYDGETTDSTTALEEVDENIYGQVIDEEGPNRIFHFLPEIMDWVQTIDCDREICAIRKRRTKLVHRHYGKM